MDNTSFHSQEISSSKHICLYGETEYFNKMRKDNVTLLKIK